MLDYFIIKLLIKRMFAISMLKCLSAFVKLYINRFNHTIVVNSSQKSLNP